MPLFSFFILSQILTVSLISNPDNYEKIIISEAKTSAIINSAYNYNIGINVPDGLKVNQSIGTIIQTPNDVNSIYYGLFNNQVTVNPGNFKVYRNNREIL